MKCKTHTDTELDSNQICSLCEYEDLQRIADDEVNFMDDDVDEDPELDEVIGFECIACGHVQDSSFSCDRCLSFSMDPIYE